MGKHNKFDVNRPFGGVVWKSILGSDGSHHPEGAAGSLWSGWYLGLGQDFDTGYGDFRVGLRFGTQAFASIPVANG